MIEIVKRNNSTFFDSEKLRRIPIFKRIFFELFFSIAVSFFINSENPNFLSAALAAQAILVGFSFNVLFFIMSSTQKKVEISENDPSIENRLSIEKNKNLYKELFYNISYFNLVSIISVILSLALLFLFPNNLTAQFSTEIRLLLGEKLIVIADSISVLSANVLKIIFYFFLIESMYTFIRIILRLNYLFRRQIKDL